VPSTPSLSPRSYAILGLLAIRDWTTYELARQMERGVGDIWTSARSMVYQEPKQLARLGLVQARTETSGRRTRTRYSITPAGLTLLRAWLAEPGAEPVWSRWPLRSCGTTPNSSAAGPPGPSSMTAPIQPPGSTRTSSARPCAEARSCRPTQITAPSSQSPDN